MGLVAAVIILFPAVLMASEEAHGGGWQKNALEMSIKIVDFAILAYFLIKFLRKPVSNYLAARADAIKSSIDELHKEKLSLKEIIDNYNEKIGNIDEEISRIKQEAHLEVEKERDLVLAEARKTADDLLKHAQETIRREFAKAKSDLYSEAVNLSLELSESLITKNINSKDQNRLAEEYINKISSKA